MDTETDTEVAEAFALKAATPKPSKTSKAK
jgi:hypothetical protein